MTKARIDQAEGEERTMLLKEFYVPSEALVKRLKHVKGEAALKEIKLEKVGRPERS